MGRQYPAAPFEWVEPALVLTFPEGVAMLRAAGVDIGDFDDLSTPNESDLSLFVASPGTGR